VKRERAVAGDGALLMSRERTVDRHVLYLGEINDSQREAWLKTIEAFDEDHRQQRVRVLASSVG
jgi:hypothetical protein